MKPIKSVVYSFFLGGLIALIAQAMLACTKAAFTGTPLQFWTGGSVLLLLGIMGCIFGGLGIYQKFEKWATFGSLLPFSGFAMAVGMKMVGPYTTKNESIGKSIWQGAWLVIWFNVLGAVVCILFGYLCTIGGIVTPTTPSNSSELIFPMAFLGGGIMTGFFQIVYLVWKKVTPKCIPLWVLLLGWMLGALLAPCGFSGWLASTFGEGFAAMIPVGGYNMYNVGVCFALGEVAEGFVHLGGFMLAVFGLFFTGLATFLIYKAKFGRMDIAHVHLQMAKDSLAEAEQTIAAAD